MQRPADADQSAYSIRRSPRAGRISLRVVPGKGLEIVLPLWADENVVPHLLEKHKKWIARALSRHVPQGSASGMPLPETVLLNGGLEEVQIIWKEAGRAQGAVGCEAAAVPESAPADSSEPLPGSAKPFSLSEAMRTAAVIRRSVTLSGGRADVSSEQALRQERLRAWVRGEAAGRLPAIVEQEALRLGLRYMCVRVKFQKSRWGSCSIRGNINLNACLLFLPEQLVRYIVIHELCHTKVLNHSPAFWKLVFSADPDALAKDRAMRTAWRFVPGWVFGKC